MIVIVKPLSADKPWKHVLIVLMIAVFVLVCPAVLIRLADLTVATVIAAYVRPTPRFVTPTTVACLNVLIRFAGLTVVAAVAAYVPMPLSVVSPAGNAVLRKPIFKFVLMTRIPLILTVYLLAAATIGKMWRKLMLPSSRGKM